MPWVQVDFTNYFMFQGWTAKVRQHWTSTLVQLHLHQNMVLLKII